MCIETISVNLLFIVCVSVFLLIWYLIRSICWECHLSLNVMHGVKYIASSPVCALIRYESERILHRISFCIKFTGHRFELYKLIKCAVKLLFFIIIDAYVYRTVVDCCCWKIPSPDSDSSKSIRETMNNSMVRKCASSAHTENETHWETKTHTQRDTHS